MCELTKHVLEMTIVVVAADKIEFVVLFEVTIQASSNPIVLQWSLGLSKVENFRAERICIE